MAKVVQLSRPRSSSICKMSPLVLLALWGVALLIASSSAEAADSTSPYGARTMDYSVMSSGEFTNALSAAHMPQLLFVFNDAESASVVGVWQRLISQVSEATALFNIKTGYLGSTSALGKEMVAGFGISVPAVLLFDGILRPVPGREGGFAKIPIGFSGDLTTPNLLRWVLTHISPDLITRVDSDEDLRQLFGKYPGYPELPRVLYFTAGDTVGPVYRVISQLYQADAVCGVVVRPFDTTDKASIASRYGIASAADLPAILVLTPQPDGRADDVVRLPGITRTSSVEDVAKELHAQLPNSAIRAMEEFVASRDRTMVDAVQRRKMYILQELARERGEIFGDDGEEYLREQGSGVGSVAEHAAVVTITSQTLWQQHCAQLRQGNYCLAVLAQQDEMESATRVLQEAALRIMKSVAVDMRGRVHFVLLDASRSEAIAQYFDFGQHGLPDVVLLSSTPPRVYFNFVGSYSPENLVRFFLTKTQTKKPVGGSRYIAHMIPAYQAAPPETTNISQTEFDEDL